MKWNTDDITKFLMIYEQYPILWDIKNKEYSNIKVKEVIFKELLLKLNDKQLAVGMDVKQLKAKIKSIRDAYRQEVHKIEKSKKSGCGTEEVYTPKLAWFDVANFLAEVVATRSSKSNYEPSQTSQDTDTVPDEDKKNLKDKNENYLEEGSKKSPEHMRPPNPKTPTPKKRFKKLPATEETPTEISQAIKKLDEIAKESSDEKPYDQFGKFVASELRRLPQRQAILLQEEIQNCIIHSKLSALEKQAPQRDRNISPFSHHSLASNSVSSMNDKDGDILQQVMVNTFGENMI